MRDVLGLVLILGWGAACVLGWLRAADTGYDLGRGPVFSFVLGAVLIPVAALVFLLGFFLIAEVVGSG